MLSKDVSALKVKWSWGNDTEGIDLFLMVGEMRKRTGFPCSLSQSVESQCRKTVTAVQVRLSQLSTVTAKATETTTAIPNGTSAGWDVQCSFHNE